MLKDVDFLGYQVCPNHKLHPSAESMRRLTTRYRLAAQQVHAEASTRLEDM